MFILIILKTLTFLSIFLCICLVATTNPIYSAFSLIALFLLTSAIFLILNIKFLTFVIIILYAGAVSILFLFIIFTLNLKAVRAPITINLISSAVLVVALCKIGSALLTALLTNETNTTGLHLELISSTLPARLTFEWHEIELVGNLLYSHYVVLFLLVSYILLLVMVGVVVIARTLNFTTKTEN